MNLQSMQEFEFERVLSEDEDNGYLAILGSLPQSNASNRAAAIVRLQRTSDLSSKNVSMMLKELIRKAELVEENDVYSWLRGWLTPSPDNPNLKIYVIFPATEAHIQKYSRQQTFMVHESPELYRSKILPYIDSLDPNRTEWVRNILSGASEAHKILYSSPGFVLLPDMKWDPATASLDKLYLVAIARSIDLKSLRDLRGKHIDFLEEIRQAARDAAKKLGLTNAASLRMFVHYQPSYCMAVGQAHLLDDIISLLRIDGDIFTKITLTYGLGEKHKLFDLLQQATAAN